MQNGLGVVLAGALGGFLYLQKQDKLKVEDQLSSELSSERSTVDELKQKVSLPAFTCFWSLCVVYGVCCFEVWCVLV